MKLKTLVVSAASVALLASTVVTAKPVGITPTVMEIAGISRNQDNKAKIHPAFALTSRKCPPFCIQPTNPFAPAKVDTISELDMIHAARDVANGDKTKLLMDNRTPVWTSAKKGGTMPHSVNIPFNTINGKAVAKDPDAVIDILTKRFGVIDNGSGILDFSKAKTLYMFCNGAWCGQSPAGIRALLKLGYPEHKLKYYRGGMNAWHQFGLTTVSK
ncbi:hypothetical protein SPONN_1285 [uncultured Candidatus Thioglobus sp.]|nr:hypothetical protein SPONL_716 [uncultured Candidatus Thioglobus sp.]SMN00132.1 hypothetical protein SPONN_1285 [uncultured Candidatus Thioglobus sp.]